MNICITTDSFSAYRLLQYEKNQRPLGSRMSNVDHLISPLIGSHDLGKQIAIIEIEYLTLSLLNSLYIRRCQSLLIILPTINTTYVYSNEFYLLFTQIEQYLLTNSFDFSIYFAFNDNNIINKLINTSSELYKYYGDHNYINYISPLKSDIRSQLMKPWSLHNLYQLKGNEESIPIVNIKYTNLFGILRNNNNNNNNDINTKYILIVANHDSFGIVPQLSFGLNDNGSGITAIMSLLNSLHKKYDNDNKYNLIFLLTAGGYTNYEGTSKWILQTNGGKTFIKNIDLVICIDSIAPSINNNDLYIYATPNFDDNKYFKNVFEEVATSMDINLNVISSVIESDTRINRWHHEEFSRKNILSITISSKARVSKLNNGTSILDRIDAVSFKSLYRNIEYISSVVLSLISSDNSNSSNIVLNERYINTYISYLSQMARFGPYHHKSQYLKKLKHDFQQYCSETHSMQYTENTNEKFYTTNVVTIQVFPIKPWIFDILFMISNLIYLFIFYVFIKQPKNFNDFIDLFSDQ